MKKLNFTKEELEKKYNERLSTFLDDCEHVSYVTGDMVCSLVNLSLKDFGVELEYKKLYKLYIDKVKSLNLTDEEWREKYGIPEIISLIYDLVEKTLFIK
jgi:dimeric dUTPase (all-alpha-NTP-PPase superfamily)